MLQTLPKVGPLPVAPAFPIAPIHVPAVERGALLLELDELIADYGAVLAQRDKYARQAVIIEHRIALARAALSGQHTMLEAAQ